jgi:hypothetical protein
VVPCARDLGDAGSPLAAFDAATDSGADSVEIARMSTEDGTLRVVQRSERTHKMFYAIWHEKEVELDGLYDSDPDVRIVDLDGNGTLDVIADTKEKATSRFHVYTGGDDRIDGTPDVMAWYWMLGSATIDAAIAAMSKVPRTDFSVPEVCGAVDRAPRGGVEAWEGNGANWSRAAKKRGPEWSCGGTMPDGASSTWMPELRCSKIVPACEALLFSGGHGGTALPHETYFFLKRVSGRLELQAVAINDH